MGRVRSGITWFDDDKWIGSEVVFDGPRPSRWRLDQKLSETESCATEWEGREYQDSSQAQGVFVCSRVGDPAQEAVIKIRMQCVPVPCLVAFDI